MKKVFITVGTTKFEELVSTVQSLEIRRELQDLSFTHIDVQYGRGQVPSFDSSPDISIECNSFDFKPSLQPYFTGANLVISHGGTIKLEGNNKLLLKD